MQERDKYLNYKSKEDWNSDEISDRTTLVVLIKQKRIQGYQRYLMGQAMDMQPEILFR